MVDFPEVRPDEIDSVARTRVRKNSATTDTGRRRRLNFIEGTNVAITAADDSINEEIDLTFGVASAAPSGNAGGALDGTYPNPGIAASVAGDGLAETSDVLSVNVDGSTIETNADALRVKDGGITNAKLATALQAWTSYTPTLTQSGAVTKTVNYAKWVQIGKTVHLAVHLSITGSGTANNQVRVGAPSAAPSAGVDIVVGSGYVADNSAAWVYNGTWRWSVANSCFLMEYDDGLDSVGVFGLDVVTSFAFANLDSLSFHATYETA